MAVAALGALWAGPVAGSGRARSVLDITEVLPAAAGAEVASSGRWALVERVQRPTWRAAGAEVASSGRWALVERVQRPAWRAAGALVAGVGAGFRREAAARAGSDDPRVFLLGDSVLLAAEEVAPVALAGWQVTMDARVSRFLHDAIVVLRARRAEIGETVVLFLGNNYLGSQAAFAAEVDEAMSVLDGVDRVLWVTVAEVDDDQWEVNAVLREAASRWPAVEVVDWAAHAAGRADLTWDDRLHLRPEGAGALCDLLAAALGPPPA